MKKISKIISIFLLIAICFSLFNTMAFADDEINDTPADEVEEVEQEVEVVQVEEKQEILKDENTDPPQVIDEEVKEVIVMQKGVAPMEQEEVNEVIIPVEEKKVEVKQEEEPIKVEEVKEEIKQVEEIKKEEVIVKQEPVVEDKKEEEPTITYPFTVTYIFYYRGANAAWKSVSASQKVTYEGFNNTKAVTFFSKQIKNNNLQTVSDNQKIYTWLGTWTGSMGTVGDGDKVYTNTTLFQEDTTIEFYADYSEQTLAHLNFIYNDNVANSGGSWSNKDRFTGYTHTFTTPADIPAHYTFLYWTDGNEQFTDGQSKTVNETDIEGEVTMTYVATYNYQPGIKLTYHMKNGNQTITSYEAVDIYGNAPVQGEWMYGDDSLIPAGTIIDLPDPIVTTEPIEQFKEVDVYAKYYDILWVNDDDTLLYTSEQMAYGDMPEYKGETPTKTKTAQYTYTFNSWTPEVVPVTGEATYKATYDATINNYTVTFKNYNGAILSQKEYPYGTKVSAIEVPTASRPATPQYTYTFAGWDKMIVDVTADATYTAMYDATVNKYLITFLNYDGKVLSERYYAYGTKAANITVPTATRESTAQYTYEFAGWDRPIADVTENAVYVANYNSDLNKYTVIWVNDDNNVLEIDKNVKYGVIPTYNSKTPTKGANAQYSYTFAGWTPAIVAVTGNAVYTARYTENINSYLVTFNPGAHGTFAPQMTYVPYGGATPAAPNPTGEEGWEFTGWDLPIGNIVYGNVTFTAQWKEIPAVKEEPKAPEQDETIRTIEDIEDDETPLAAPLTWALVNLILLVFTIFTLWKGKDKEYTVFTPISVIAALALFILTENVYNLMVLVDKWTIWQLVIYIVSLLSRIFAKKQEQEQKEEIKDDQ